MRRLLFAVSCLLLSISSSFGAMTLSDAKKLYLNGEYSKALPEFERQYKRSPRNASINHWLGVCLFYEGDFDKAEKYLVFADKKNVQESSFYLAKINYLRYRSEKVSQYLSRYESLVEKSKNELTVERALEIDAMKRAVIMMDHVENIEVIDSMVVDKTQFFNFYKISPESGFLKSSSVLPDGSSSNTGVVFMPELAQRMMWTENDSSGVSHLMESTKLIDDTWESPRMVGVDLGEGGNVLYPYMMPDGATLYFASDGAGSIGGYDIFMTRRDSETLEYFKAQNMGYPYNSPYDDYLLVIDEFTGVGWWATDRNRIEGQITIYIFRPQEVRENYTHDNPALPSLAALKRIKDTWREGEDYSQLLNDIASIGLQGNVKKRDFIFPFADGEIYVNLEDFKSPEAKSMMKSLLKMKTEFNNKSQQLGDLRSDFAKNNNAQTGEMILSLEKEIESMRSSIFELENNIRISEKFDNQ